MALTIQTSSQHDSTISEHIDQDLMDIHSFLDQIRSFKLPESDSSHIDSLPLSALRFEENN